jgi:hypothetical protein
MRTKTSQASTGWGSMTAESVAVATLLLLGGPAPAVGRAPTARADEVAPSARADGQSHISAAADHEAQEEGSTEAAEWPLPPQPTPCPPCPDPSQPCPPCTGATSPAPKNAGAAATQVLQRTVTIYLNGEDCEASTGTARAACDGASIARVTPDTCMGTWRPFVSGRTIGVTFQPSYCREGRYTCTARVTYVCP